MMDGFPVHGGVPKLLCHLKQRSHWFDCEDPPKILLEPTAVSQPGKNGTFLVLSLGIGSFLLDMTMGDHHKSPDRDRFSMFFQ